MAPEPAPVTPAAENCAGAPHGSTAGGGGGSGGISGAASPGFAPTGSKPKRQAASGSSSASGATTDRLTARRYQNNAEPSATGFRGACRAGGRRPEPASAAQCGVIRSAQ